MNAGELAVVYTAFQLSVNAQFLSIMGLIYAALCFFDQQITLYHARFLQ